MSRINKSIFRFLIDPSFLEGRRLFVLSFENETQQIRYEHYYLPTREIRNYNVMVVEQNVFDQPIRNNLTTYYNIGKISTGQGDYYTTYCFLDYNNFKNYNKMIAIDLCKHQALDANPKARQQINFTRNLEQQSTIFFIIKEAKKKILDFDKELYQYSNFIFALI